MKTLLFYSALFLVLALFLYGIFHKAGRNFIIYFDGAYQHYPAFNYICEMEEAILSGKESLSSLGPYCYSIGQGADLLTTQNSYDLTDPVSWASGLLLFLSRPQRYTVMVFAKLWLTGFAFLVYCFARDKRNTIAVLCGSVSYAFSGAVITVLAWHPNYINWAFFLPLLLAGYELYRRKKKGALLLFSVFFNLLVSFYTFYMNAILLVIYMLIKGAANVTNDRSRLRKELIVDLKAAGLCLTGIMLDAVTFFPTVYAFSQNPRLGGLTGYSDSAFHYAWDYYAKLFFSVFTPYTDPGYWTYIGLLPVIVIPLILLFCRKKQNLELKLWVIVLGILTGVPIFGRFMNGMGYATNRWTYAIPFFCAVIFTEVFDDIIDAEPGHRKLTIAVGSFYLALCCLRFDIQSGILQTGMIIMMAWVLLVYGLLGATGRKQSAVCLLLMTVICAFFEVDYTFSRHAGNKVGQFEEIGSFDNYYADSARKISNLSTPDDFFRVESREKTANISGINHVNGTDLWWSMLPAYWLDYYTGLESGEVLENCNFRGLDGRTGLLELASVKYYTKRTDSGSLIPYGYSYAEDLSDDVYSVFENEYCLPVGYMFDKAVTKEEYDALTPIQKQEALTQTAVIDDLSTVSVAHGEPSFSSYLLDYEITETDGVELLEGRFQMNHGNCSLTLRTVIPENAEIYLQIDGIYLVSPSGTSLNLSRTSEDGQYGAYNSGWITNETSYWDFPRTGVAYNLGFGGAGANSIVISFGQTGVIQYKSLNVIALPMEQYASDVRALSENTLQNAYVDGRTITGSVSLSEPKILQLSVPYSKGWTAYVDGQKTDLLQSGVMYMSVGLESGDHEIKFTYTTPYFKVGAVVSILILVGLIMYRIIAFRIDKRRDGPYNDGKDTEFDRDRI